jgi:dTDP-4-amino-4,6-dideoxygalactose transaminase
MIRVSNPQAAYMYQRNEIDNAIQRVLHSGMYVRGMEVLNFEKEFAKYVGAKYCVSCGSGTDAMGLAIRALKKQKHTGFFINVVTVSLTAQGTIANLVNHIAELTPIDVDSSMTMDLENLERCINNKYTSVIIPVHLYGNPVNMRELKRIAGDIPIIEDCCQAHGTRIGRQHVGTFGEMGIFSFYPTKNLGAIGDGGAVVTNDEELYELLRLYRQFGWKEGDKNNATLRTGQSRLDTLQAAILRVKLPLLNNRIATRRRNADLLKQILQYKFTMLDWRKGCSYHQFVIMLENKEQRESFMQYMKEKDIQTLIHYPIPLHLQDAYKSWFTKTDLPKTEEYCDRIVSLPVYPELSGQELSRIGEAAYLWSDANL